MRKRIVIRQSCCDRLTKAIDAYIRKADNNLSDQLGKEGYAKPKKNAPICGEYRGRRGRHTHRGNGHILSEKLKHLAVWKIFKRNSRP